MLDPNEEQVAPRNAQNNANGTFAFQLQYHEPEERYSWTLGYFLSVEDAKIGMANWIIDEWSNTGKEPWLDEPVVANSEAVFSFDDPMEEYIKTYSVKHIIDFYFSNTIDNYSIDSIWIPNSVKSYATGLIA